MFSPGYFCSRVQLSHQFSTVICGFYLAVLLVSVDAWLAYMVRKARKNLEIDSYVPIYGGLFAAALVFSLLRAFVFYQLSLRSSAQLHDRMTVAILKAPVYFFDVNPIGRILNRFSKDIGSMDEILPTFFLLSIQLVLGLGSSAILPCLLNPWILLAVIPSVIVALSVVKFFLKSSRELKRLESICRSPVYSHFAETLNGLDTIRSRKREKDFTEALYRYATAPLLSLVPLL